MIENIDETGIENLTNAIVLQAVKDYRRALSGCNVNGRDSKSVIAECERFFQSEWFNVLTNVDGMIIIANIRKEFEV